MIELNEAFASQAIATLRDLGVDPFDPRVNPNGGAIALGHPLGMSGARIALWVVEELQRTGGALCPGLHVHRCGAGPRAVGGRSIAERRYRLSEHPYCGRAESPLGNRKAINLLAWSL
jgi:acetyl-CoA acetyltransferase